MTEDESVTALIFFYLIIIIIIIFDKILLIKLSKLLILLTELLLLFHCPCLEVFCILNIKPHFNKLAQAVKMFYKSGQDNHRQKVAKVHTIAPEMAKLPAARLHVFSLG